MLNVTIPMPSGMDFIPASAFVLTLRHVYHALKDRGDLRPRNIAGAGGGGRGGARRDTHWASDGPKVIAAASNDAKLQNLPNRTAPMR